MQNLESLNLGYAASYSSFEFGVLNIESTPTKGSCSEIVAVSWRNWEFRRGAIDGFISEPETVFELIKLRS